MSYLLDTHMVIWAIDDGGRLPSRVRSILDDPNEAVFISSITFAEMAIKMSLGKLKFKSDPFRRIKETRVHDLPFIWRHARGLETLPFIHRDPFDRMLIAQAISEDFTILTADRSIQEYDVRTLT